MTLDDKLRDLMAERSAGGGSATVHLDQIYRGIARRRTRMIGAVSAVTVGLLAFSAGSAFALRHRPADATPTVVGASTPDRPSPSASAATFPLLQLPERAHGQRLVVQKAELLSPEHASYQLVFTPTQWNFSIGLDCAAGLEPADHDTDHGPTREQLEVTINGSALPYMVTFCTRTAGQSSLPEVPPTNAEARSWWQHINVQIGSDTPVELGKPMTITIKVGTPQPVHSSITGADILRSGPFADKAGTAVVGIYQPDA
jgi:hypothetical protein